MSAYDEDDWAATLAVGRTDLDRMQIGEDDEMAGWENGGGNGRQQQGGKPKYQHKENRGSMFENDHKTKETQPDFNGSVNVKGTIYWINGWKQMTQSGKKQISLSVQPQEERQPGSDDQSQQRKRATW